MRVQPKDADKFAKQPPSFWTAVLLFGPNAGLVRERAQSITQAIVPDLKDGFRLCEISADALKRDPARLADEVGAISMFGGRRVIRVTDAGDSTSSIFESFLINPIGDALVVVEGGELTKTSSLRKLFEGHKACGAIECTDDSVQDTTSLIRQTIEEAGWKIEPEAVEYLATTLQSDRRILRGELEKLISFLGPKPDGGSLTRAQAMVLVGDSGEVAAEVIADAVADGDVRRLGGLLLQGSEAGVPWGVVVGFALRQLQRISAAVLASGPVWGKTASQMQGWDRARLGKALAILAEAEFRTRSTGFPEATVAKQALLSAAMLRRKN